jgi:Zn-dependent protease
MGAFQNGSLRLFRVAGIDIMIHWSWIIVALIEAEFRDKRVFGSGYWDAALFLTMFGIVLLHELGHVTACRQVGGTANRIVLWPLGGVAVVNPPPRPWAVFWSVAGGPLVNVVLIPVILLGWLACSHLGWTQQYPNLHTFFQLTTGINIFLLVFNLLPMFPNDGGQMLYAVLWAFIGRGPGLMVTSVFGIIGGGLVCALCLFGVFQFGATGLLVLAFFALMLVLRSLAALAQARTIMRVMSGPRHPDASCPSCSARPLQGAHWVCDECSCRFDTFATLAECPQCSKRFDQTNCPECGRKNSIVDWFPRYKRPAAPSPAPAEPPFRPHAEWDQDVPREYS